MRIELLGSTHPISLATRRNKKRRAANEPAFPFEQSRRLHISVTACQPNTADDLRSCTSVREICRPDRFTITVGSDTRDARSRNDTTLSVVPASVVIPTAVLPITDHHANLRIGYRIGCCVCLCRRHRKKSCSYQKRHCY